MQNALMKSSQRAISPPRSGNVAENAWRPAVVGNSADRPETSRRTMEHHIAEQVVAALINAYGKISNNLLLIMRECTEKEFFAYRRGTGGAMGYLLDIIGPILRE